MKARLCTCAPLLGLDDVIFAKNRDRVNSCGKDILIDQAAKQAGTDYDIVLVGQRDADEQSSAIYGAACRARGERHTLDEQRVLNFAAVLSGGTAAISIVGVKTLKTSWLS